MPTRLGTAFAEKLPSWPQAPRLPFLPDTLPLFFSTDLFTLSHLSLFLRAPSSNAAALERWYQPWNCLTFVSSESITNLLESPNPYSSSIRAGKVMRQSSLDQKSQLLWAFQDRFSIAHLGTNLQEKGTPLERYSAACVGVGDVK